MGPFHPTLRASPFPKVTDQICRLPLPTFFQRLEVLNLGDLLRLLVRVEVRIILGLGFSRLIISAPDIQKFECFAICNLLSPDKSIPGNHQCQEEKRTLPGANVKVTEVTCVAAHYPRSSSGILTDHPFV